MKKLLSILSAFALVLAFVVTPVQAATITGSAARGDDNTLTITVTGLAGDISNTAGDIFNVTVKTLDDGSAVDISGGSAVHGDNGTFGTAAFNTTGITLTASGNAGTPSKVITLTSAGSFTTAEDYVVVVEATAGNNTDDVMVATVIASTQNQVTVTATVEPTLTMAVANTAIDFGTLNVTGNNATTTDTEITLSTNATNGAVISATTVGADTGSTANVLGVSGETDTISALGAETDPAAFNDATEYFAATLTLNAPTLGASLAADNNFSNGDDGTADRANDVTGNLASVAGPTDSATLDVTYNAGITSITEAGNYSATITYAVTATF